ncbi:MAG: hypothetical protein CM15mP70_11420 [Pelagibacteraceae bacterium]|nr:MAG: hypothetical protein CM15mP70_11420 [Pelagibacteraceae bacterium]
MLRLLILLLIPYFAFADKHVPYYKSLSKSESWLRHYPDLRDFKEQTEKFFLTHKGMPVKVIEEYQSVGNNYIDWYELNYSMALKVDLSQSINPKKNFVGIRRYRTLCLKFL